MNPAGGAGAALHPISAQISSRVSAMVKNFWHGVIICFLYFGWAAEVFCFVGGSSALFAEVFRLVDELFVLCGSSLGCPEVCEVAEVLVVA